MPSRRATGSDLDTVVQILVGAFFDDPTWAWALPDASRRTDQLRRLWTVFLHGAMRYENVYLSAGDTAAAVWIPPGGTDLSEEQEADLEAAIGDILGDDLPRVLETFERFEERHPRDVPHYYLSLLGTDTGHRGHGYGLSLLAENLRQIDATGMPAYLEASNPVNVALYARYEFVVREEFCPGPGAPAVTTMWRQGSK